MATKQEITAAIREGIDRVQNTFGSLDDAQLQTAVHEGEDGWTAKAILAHLAGRAQGYALMERLAAGEPPPAGLSINRFNQDRVDERIDRSRDELLAEFRAVHEGLIDRVEALDDDTLARPVQLGPQPLPLGDIMVRSGGRHSVMHAREVEQALGLGSAAE